MSKYTVNFYNRFACQNQTFCVIANDDADAERLFWLKHNREQFKDCIEDISEYSEDHFYTEEEILNSL